MGGLMVTADEKKHAEIHFGRFLGSPAHYMKRHLWDQVQAGGIQKQPRKAFLLRVKKTTETEAVQSPRPPPFSCAPQSPLLSATAPLQSLPPHRPRGAPRARPRASEMRLAETAGGRAACSLLVGGNLPPGCLFWVMLHLSSRNTWIPEPILSCK